MASYVGDDGQRYRDPCTSKRGNKKERWPNETAAWFVVELVARGEHRAKGKPAKMYPYLCPKCHGWHLASCRTVEQVAKHEAGLASIIAERAAQNRANSDKKGPLK